MAKCEREPVVDQECPCSGRNLARFVQPAVLTVLARGERHGYQILEEIAATAPFKDQRPDLAGIYRTLNAMQERGLCTSHWETGESGPAKRRYAITAAGRQCLGRWIDTLSAYRDDLTQILQQGRRALKAAAQDR
jgi:DNA-binding PadR family transcriptional regulator